MLAWLFVWDEVQICIWPSWCHCHSLSLAPVNPDWFYLPGFTFLVPGYPGSPGPNPERCKMAVLLVVVVLAAAAAITYMWKEIMTLTWNPKVIWEDPHCHSSCRECTHLLCVLLAVQCPITQPPVCCIHTTVPHFSYTLGLHCVDQSPSQIKNLSLSVGGSQPHH